MATLQSTGIGSGLDVNGLVTQLVAAERAAKQGQITKQQTQVATKITAMGSLKGALGAFQTALAGLKTTEVFSSRSAKSGDEKMFTVSAGVNATPSTYGVEVRQLAKAQQIASDPFASSTAAVGTGLLTLSVGDKSFTVNITDENSSLEGIRDAINGASDNAGVSAAIVRAQDGAHLVLTSSTTGAANVIKVATSEGDGGLGVLTYDAAGGDTANFAESKPAHDAIIEVAGFEHRSASNTVTTAIDGVTLTLLKEEPGTEVSLEVKLDRDNASSRINNFVAAFNQVASTMAQLQSYDPATKRAGALLGDAMIRGIEGDLRAQLVSPITDTASVYDTLASIGITTKKDGSLEVNSAKLTTALERDFEGVAKLFGSENGVAARLDAVITPRLDSKGEIAERNKILDQRTASLSAEQTRLNARMEIVQQRYLKQFIALDSLLGQMQQTSNYLMQQLASLPKIGG